VRFESSGAGMSQIVIFRQEKLSPALFELPAKLKKKEMPMPSMR
jgi:hypothetical protein